jgi:hypothetical protein
LDIAIRGRVRDTRQNACDRLSYRPALRATVGEAVHEQNWQIASRRTGRNRARKTALAGAHHDVAVMPRSTQPPPMKDG